MRKNSANANVLVQSRRLLHTLKNLISDEYGRPVYVNYADQIIEYVTGLPHQASLILAAENPSVAAVKFMRRPGTSKMSGILCGHDDEALQCMYAAVVCLYRMSVISQIPRKHVTKDTQKAYKVYRKAFKKAMYKLRDDFSVAKSQKALAKSEVADIWDYINRTNYSLLFDLDDEDEDEEDDEVRFDYDDGSDDQDFADMVLQRRQKGHFDGDDSQLALSADEIGIEPELERPYRDARPMLSNNDYDFSGKATLDVIADRLEAILESNQLIINRLYGREISTDKDLEKPLVEDITRPNPAFEAMVQNMQKNQRTTDGPTIDPVVQEKLERLRALDLKKLSVTDLISIYNSLSDELRSMTNTGDRIFNLSPTPEAAPADDDDDGEDEVPDDPTASLPVLGEEDYSPDDTDEPEDKELPRMTYEEAVELTSNLDQPKYSAKHAGVAEQLQAQESDTANETYGTTEAEVEKELPFPKEESVADQFNRERS